MRARLGWIGWALLGIFGGTALLAVVTPMGRYLLRGAWEEGKILARRRSIAGLIADSATPPATRAKLQLVLDARRFAVDSLGLEAGEAFTKFTKPKHDTLVLVLSGTRRDALVPATWWFPVVGRVPYKGFFDFDAARRAERTLADAGFDTYLRPAPAFSTLGWFNDPLLSTTLATDSLFVVQTVIHELTHNRIYVKGQAVFNESFAEFVGGRGAVEFFRARGDTASARRAEAAWHDELILGAVWERGYRDVDSVFSALPYSGDGQSGADTLVRARRLAARDSVYARLRRHLVDSVAPRLRSIDASFAQRVRLDNAALLARRIYATGLGEFEAAWERQGQRVRATLDRVSELARRGGEPFAALRP